MTRKSNATCEQKNKNAVLATLLLDGSIDDVVSQSIHGLSPAVLEPSHGAERLSAMLFSGLVGRFSSPGRLLSSDQSSSTGAGPLRRSRRQGP